MAEALRERAAQIRKEEKQRVRRRSFLSALLGAAVGAGGLGLALRTSGPRPGNDEDDPELRDMMLGPLERLAAMPGTFLTSVGHRSALSDTHWLAVLRLVDAARLGLCRETAFVRDRVAGLIARHDAPRAVRMACASFLETR